MICLCALLSVLNNLGRLLINGLFYDLFCLVLVHTGFNNRLTWFFLLFGPVNFLLIDFSFW